MTTKKKTPRRMGDYFSRERCPICGATVLARRTRLPARISKAYAMADHVRAIHADLLPARRGA